MSAEAIPFNRPFLTGAEAGYIAEAMAGRKLSGDGPFTARCHRLLEAATGTRKALLTTSCTAALEMAAMLCDLETGDEVILPSYTFVSTANAFVLRGAVAVFVDIDPATQNIDPARIEAAITPRTRAICVVHYAGIACDMPAIMAIAQKHGLRVVEDAAQAVGSTLDGKPLGTFGDLGCLSFHETKNIVAGEGGALLINDPALIERAEVLREKGTNRSRFFRGQVDKYTWIDIGSSYLPGELIAAFLAAQLEHMEAINARRMAIWNRYHEGLAATESAGRLKRPVVPPGATHNGHLYYALLRDLDDRSRVIERLNAEGIAAVFHYVPLHSAPAGRRLGRVEGPMTHTDHAGDCLMRLPLFPEVDVHVDRILDSLHRALQ